MKTVALLAALLIAGCARRGVPAPPRVPEPVTVFAPSNRTGRPLVVAGTSFLERYALKTDRVTVEDVLAAYLRDGLSHHGLAVTAPEEVEGRVPGSATAAAEVARTAKLGGSVLYVEITQWETDGAMQPAYIIVGLDAVLIDVATGERPWAVHREATPVATPGTVTLGTAYITAAQKVVDELLLAWPSRPQP